jgi:hypothetical protein
MDGAPDDETYGAETRHCLCTLAGMLDATFKKAHSSDMSGVSFQGVEAVSRVNVPGFLIALPPHDPELHRFPLLAMLQTQVVCPLRVWVLAGRVDETTFDI